MTIDQGARRHVADHLERGRVDAEREPDHVVEEADLRLIEEGPEIADDGGRQHHRDQDHGGPEAMAAELAVDEVGEREAEQRLDGDGRDDEARRHLHAVPDVGIGQQVGIAFEPSHLSGAFGRLAR